MKTLQTLKDETAIETYGIEWSLLNDNQRANLVDIVATEYAIEHIKNCHERTDEILGNVFSKTETE